MDRATAQDAAAALDSYIRTYGSFEAAVKANPQVKEALLGLADQYMTAAIPVLRGPGYEYLGAREYAKDQLLFGVRTPDGNEGPLSRAGSRVLDNPDDAVPSFGWDDIGAGVYAGLVNAGAESQLLNTYLAERGAADPSQFREGTPGALFANLFQQRAESTRTPFQAAAASDAAVRETSRRAVELAGGVEPEIASRVAREAGAGRPVADSVAAEAAREHSARVSDEQADKALERDKERARYTTDLAISANARNVPITLALEAGRGEIARDNMTHASGLRIDELGAQGDITRDLDNNRSVNRINELGVQGGIARRNDDTRTDNIIRAGAAATDDAIRLSGAQTEQATGAYQTRGEFDYDMEGRRIARNDRRPENQLAREPIDDARIIGAADRALAVVYQGEDLRTREGVFDGKPADFLQPRSGEQYMDSDYRRRVLPILTGRARAVNREVRRDPKLREVLGIRTDAPFELLETAEQERLMEIAAESFRGSRENDALPFGWGRDTPRAGLTGNEVRDLVQRYTDQKVGSAWDRSWRALDRLDRAVWGD